jgi:hypothetical protein
MVSRKTDVAASDKNGKRLRQMWQIITEYPKYSSELPESANSIPKLKKLGKNKNSSGWMMVTSDKRF